MEVLSRQGVPMGGVLGLLDTIFFQRGALLSELVSELPDISLGKAELAARCVEDKVSSPGIIGER